ncbi:hypothetical protein DAEQUDRAFT_702285 [Daedalea quercina L-15889]|uniref:Uncharacterized protein n=1 Tax=Daedalea quercina L-15889 TaxID=1314783 RepID=A0A165TWZ3_9APHY|nr:hypothetical protein DAEQUDRAFT_702285 [Daedalea quercina L-15889]
MHDEPTGPITGAHRLSPGQERKLVDYLEEHLLNITRNYKKRSHPSSTLPSLASYLAAVHPLLVLILQIPPAEPSASLRTSLLLRLTGEVLGSITGYRPDIDTLPQLLQWLDELDRGWLAVLRGQAWNPASHSGIDIGVPSQTAGNGSDAAGRGRPRPSTSQTDRTRLRSILIDGTNQMEEWLADIDSVDENYQAALETMDMQRGFNDLFAQTLGEMGSLDGSMPIDSQRMVGTC